MIIQVSVSNGFSHPSVLEQQFQLDIDANQDVENLKVHITLRFVDLGPNDFDLICVPTNQLLANNLMVHSIDKDENERIHVEIVHRHSAFCTLI